MSSWLVFLIIIPVSVLLGGLVVLKFVPYQQRLSLSLVFATVTAGVVRIGWLAHLLAEFGLLSLAFYMTARELAENNDNLPTGSVLIFNDQAPVGRGNFLGTSSKFIFGHDVFTLCDLEALDDG